MVYGVLGLVGFLAQMVIGVNSRLLPLFSWLTAYAGDSLRTVPPSPHAMPQRRPPSLMGYLNGNLAREVGRLTPRLLTGEVQALLGMVQGMSRFKP